MSCNIIIQDTHLTRKSRTLQAEAERIAWNRRIVAGDLARDPASWHGGQGNIDVLDVLLGDALAALLRHPMMMGVAS